MKIDESTPTTVEELAGVPEGTVIDTPAGQPNEVVVGDVDQDGNVVGWHKEVESN